MNADDVAVQPLTAEVRTLVIGTQRMKATLCHSKGVQKGL